LLLIFYGKFIQGVFMSTSILYSQLIKEVPDKAFLLKPKQSKELKKLMQQYDLTLHEATLFTYILKLYVQKGRNVSLDELEDNELDITVGNDNYLKLVKIVHTLIKKDLLIVENRRNRSNLVNPDVCVDETIFSKIVLGIDMHSQIDFTNFYSIVQAVQDLLEKRDEKKLSEDRFFKEFEMLIKKIDSSLKLGDLLKPYTPIEQVMFFAICVKAIQGNTSLECNRFATDIYDDLSSVAWFMEHIFQNKFQIFKDGILELTDEDNFRIDPDFKLSAKVHRAIFGSSLKSKQRFEAHLTKHISYKTCKQTLFLDETIANITHTLATAISKEHYKRIVKELKDAQLPSGLVTLLYGYPGTGKTATVYEISKLTKRDILQVDIASIRDKYVGESEKKLKGIFKEYARAKEELKHVPILLFNEADALFGQRMDTNDSVDVMNNSMQNILLEELEKFEGIFFATTNLINNMDNAFDRRFLYKVEFTKPSQQTRAKIWQSKLPQLDAKTSQIIAEYDLTGGQIENVTRKYMVDKILNLKGFNLEELKQLCRNELHFKQENKQLVGFR